MTDSRAHMATQEATGCALGMDVGSGANEAAGAPLTITIPAPYFPPVRDRKTGKLKPVGPFINSNQRYHRHQEAKMTKAWREAAALRAHGIPQFEGQVRIVAHIWKPRDTFKFDPNNLADTTKAIVDGLVDAGLFIDDSREYVVGPDHRWGGKGPAAVIITISQEKT